mgnify:CR=1 FL=1
MSYPGLYFPGGPLNGKNNCTYLFTPLNKLEGLNLPGGLD